MSTLISLSIIDLVLAAALVAALAVVVWLGRLGVARTMTIAVVRMVIQLSLLGLVLEVLFGVGALHWVALMALVMLLVAGREVSARQKRPLAGLWGFGLSTGAMFLSSFAMAVFALLAVVQPEPWFKPQYAIPLLGMLLGNTMTGIALSLDRLTTDAWEQREIIETRLMLGATWSEAISGLRAQAMRNGMIPMINAMAAAGVVSLPGMMTGQILAGAPPAEAVKYQVLIFLLIVAGTGFGTLLAVWLTALRLFDDRERLRLDRLRRR
ncbi:iron export ABC transporter permease subunit FetB [Ectothiorhodospiraceae bacterium WFHF3C12]|nr:iron export ABC transporter permease subunit FetB [Ectothiorhodospiraceae bacterium WFHF3C12]